MLTDTLFHFVPDSVVPSLCSSLMPFEGIKISGLPVVKYYSTSVYRTRGEWHGQKHSTA
jgi:hypothetical protein